MAKVFRIWKRRKGALGIVTFSDVVAIVPSKKEAAKRIKMDQNYYGKNKYNYSITEDDYPKLKAKELFHNDAMRLKEFKEKIGDMA